MKQTHLAWETQPGNIDYLHMRHIFPSNDGKYGIPYLAHTPLSYVPQWLIPYRTRVRSEKGFTGGAVHFFLDDYRFESVWTRPNRALDYLEHFEVLLSPDFSLYTDWPIAAQVWNTYRSRWCGALWQSLGYIVIPSVSWSTPESFEFCFNGLPQRSVLAVSTVGTQKQSDAEDFFMIGFKEMVNRLQPSMVLCYGKPYERMAGLTNIKEYPTYWDGLQQVRYNRKKGVKKIRQEAERKKIHEKPKVPRTPNRRPKLKKLPT